MTQGPRDGRQALSLGRIESLLIALGGFGAYFIAYQLIPFILMAVGGITLPKSGTPLAEALILLTAWGTVVSALVYFGARTVGVLPPNPDPGTSRTRRLLWIPALSAVTLLGQTAISAIQGELGVPPEEQEIVRALIRTDGYHVLVMAAVIAPLGEELMFRRFLFTMLTRTWGGRLTAYLLGSVLFSLIHFNPSGLLLYVWMGACFAYAYEKTGSVWGATAVHAVNNGMVVAIGMATVEAG